MMIIRYNYEATYRDWLAFKELVLKSPANNKFNEAL